MTETLSLQAGIKSIIKIPTFRTSVIEYGNKVEQRIANDSAARYKFKVTLIDKFPDAVMDALITFFLARKGSYEAFYFPSTDEIYRNLKWASGTVYYAGNIVRPTTINNHSYICTVGGTSHSSEPAWPTTVAGTVADNTVTWKENTYLVRFETDVINYEYFHYSIATFGEFTLIEVAA